MSSIHKSRRIGEGQYSNDCPALGYAGPVLFLDCDDTLYWKDNREVARQLTRNIGQFCYKNFGLDSSAGYSLYSKYGTCIKGLIEEGYIKRDDATEIARYFDETHSIDLSQLIGQDVAVRRMIERLHVPTWVLTVGPMQHCLRCLDLIGVRDLLPNVIDTAMCNFETKRKPICYRLAMEMAQVSNPKACILVDDSAANLEAAKGLGWQTVLVNPDGKLQGPFPGVDHVIDNVTLLPTVLPDIFGTLSDADTSSEDEMIVSVNEFTGKRSRRVESVDTAASDRGSRYGNSSDRVSEFC